jgi:hypothetical protein
MAHLLLKTEIEFGAIRARDIPLLLVPRALIVGVDDGSNAEILDSAYLIQYPFLDGFGFVKGDCFRLSAGLNLICFPVEKYSKFRLLPLRKQTKLTISFWAYTMPIYNDPNGNSSTTSSTSSVAASITQTTLMEANDKRKGGTIYNNSSLGTLYIGFGSTVTTSLFAGKIAPNALWDMPNDYDGKIVGIWSATGGNALVTEFQ